MTSHSLRRRFPRLAVIALSTFMATGCTRYAENHLRSGDALFQAQDYADAIREYDKTARVQPDNPRAMRQLGLAHMQVGHRREAYAYLTKARTLRPRDLEVRLALGSLYLGDSRPDEAIKEAMSVLSDDSSNVAALNLVGIAHLRKRQPAEANAAFRRIIAAKPKDPKGPYLLGLGLLNEGKVDQAIPQFESALALEPGFADATTQLVTIELAQGRSDAALARVRSRIAQDTKSARLQNLLGYVLAQRSDRFGAEQAFRKAIALDARYAEPHLRLAQVYTGAGDTATALAEAGKALELDPADLGAMMLIAYVNEQRGDLTVARTMYERAVAAAPSAAAPANNLALLLIEHGGDARRALALATRARDAAPGDARVADTYGWVLFRIGEVQKASGILRECATRLPDDGGVQFHYGIVAAQAGDTTAARAALGRAAEIGESAAEKQAARNALAALKVAGTQ